MVWSQYFWYPPIIDPGGYITDPFFHGAIPPYFWSQTGLASDPKDPTDISIFANFAKINKQFYDPQHTGKTEISWLRMSDQIDFQRTWFRATHIWLGAPYAHWDADIYSRDDSPYPPPPLLPIS